MGDKEGANKKSKHSAPANDHVTINSYSDSLRSLKELIDSRDKTSWKINDFKAISPKQTTVGEEVARKRKIENDAAEQDNQLKKVTLVILFIFLALETIAIFIIAFLQGLGDNSFLLEEWNFRVLVGATIGQITSMLIVAVRHLFPRK